MGAVAFGDSVNMHQATQIDGGDEEEEKPDIGILSKPENQWSICRQYFPSKAGGVPVSAPVSGMESTCSRMLFVFMCPSLTYLLRDQHEQRMRHSERPCRSVKVFCCQLPRFNLFYSCKNLANDGSQSPAGSRVESNDMWPEFLIIIKKKSEHSSEDNSVDNIEDNSDISGEDTLRNSLSSRNGIDDPMNSLLNSFQGDDDRSLAYFQERIANAQEQVLRRYRNTSVEPMWPLSSGQPSNGDIPNCSYCGGRMCCEFQILPNLLWYFKVDNEANSLDWASIVVYACEASCDASLPYKHKYAWVQLY